VAPTALDDALTAFATVDARKAEVEIATVRAEDGVGHAAAAVTPDAFNGLERLE
jgi:hypothetical protein